MKRILLCLVTFAFLLSFASCTSSGLDHTHAFSAWDLTTVPTEDAYGEATKTCDCGRKVTIKVPALTNEHVWTLSENVEATFVSAGYKVYTSEYGTVRVELAQLEHVWSAWELTVEPTLTEEGSAKRTCACGEVEEVVVPALSDTSVWSVHSHTDSTCVEEGETVRVSIYGLVHSVVETIPHSFGAWVWVEQPTLTEAGSMERTCTICNTEKETKEVPALSDDSVWEMTGEVYSTYTQVGSQTYSSTEFGEVTIEIAKKDAPFYNIKYYNFAYDVELNGGYEEGNASPILSWTAATIELDNEAKGFGTGFPFNYDHELKLVNKDTGEVEVTSGTTKYKAYVDFATGMVVRQRFSSFNYLLVYTPYGAAVSADLKAFAWEDSIAIEYSANGTTYLILVHDEVVYFGATLKDEAGAALSVAELESQDYIYAFNGEELICAYVNDGSKFVECDGFEGTYDASGKPFIVSGYGACTYEGAEGTYELVEGKAYDAEVYVGGAYYEVSLDKAALTAAFVKPMVTVSFEVYGKADCPAQSVNKNIEFTLPVPVNADYVFRGWFAEETFATAVAEKVTPTADVKYYAKWSKIVTINLVGVADGDASVLKIGAGDVIGDYLPEYGVDVANNRVFRGWYLDAEYNVALSESAEVTESDNNITVYCKWEELPAYYGSYKGTEIWGESSGNYASKDLTIDENGKITGTYTGTVTEYDPSTQKITWKNTSNKTLYFWYDEYSGVLVADYYSKTEISSDFYVFAKDATSYKVKEFYNINTTLDNGNKGFYIHFVNLDTVAGNLNIMINNVAIYSHILLKNAKGETLKVSEIKNSKSIVCLDPTTGEILFACASKGASFDDDTNTVELDNFFGTYLVGEKQLILDGTGGVVYEGKTGTYTAAPAGSMYMFDVYLDEGKEYYELTVQGANATLIKPMVTVSFVTGDGHNPVADIQTNKNVPFALPVLVEESYVFNGWFAESTFETALGASIVPTAAVTVYAKFSLPAVLTLVFNNGEGDQTIVYSVGDVAIIEDPLRDHYAFAGWYTTEEFTEGSEWTSGSVINEDTTIYAKWNEAPIYSNSYLPVEITGKNANGNKSSLYDRDTAILNVDPYGKAVCTSYPFRGDVTVSFTDEALGKVKIEVVNGSSTNTYNGYIDPVSRIIVITKEYTSSANFDEVILLDPFATDGYKNISSSYWNKGKVRLISYNNEGTVYTAFIYNNEVKFGYSFVDADGVAVDVNNAYKAPYICVKDVMGTVVCEFGFDGTTMQVLDGLQGTYTSGEDTLTINGISTAVFKGVSGTYAKAAEGSAYTIDVYANGYYEVTLDVAAKTFTYNKPMVTITFDAGDKAVVPAAEVNKNIAFELPQPTNESFVFMGWFKDSELTQPVENLYTPTESCTLYAKWSEKITLTLTVGNGYENVVLYLYQGQQFDLDAYKPAYKDGKAFDGWYLEATCETLFTETSIQESTVIYAKWIERGAYTLTNKSSNPAYGFAYEDGQWVSKNKGKNSSNSTMELVALADITVDLTFWCSSEAATKWDWLQILLNNEKKAEAGGSSSTAADAKSLTLTLKAGDVLVIKYVKDSSSAGGLDTAFITSFKVDGVQVTDYAE